MRRTLVISEEFGLWRVESSAGAHGTGHDVGTAIRNFWLSSGANMELLDELELSGGPRPKEILELCIPKPERRDQPLST